MAKTDRQDPYAGDPTKNAADRTDGAVTHRQDPYAGDPDRVAEDRDA
jgi:hypothetical protein